MKTLKLTGKSKVGKENLRELLIKSSHTLTAMYTRPINMLPNLSLDSDLSSGVSHMQII